MPTWAFCLQDSFGEADLCWPEISPSSHLHGIIPEVSQPELNYLCTTTSPVSLTSQGCLRQPGRIPQVRPLRKSWVPTGLVSGEHSTCGCHCVQAPGADTASLPRAELQQHYQHRSGTSSPWRAREGQCSPGELHWGPHRAGAGGQLRVSCCQVQEPGAGQRSCAPGHGHPEAPAACCKARPLF